MEWELALGDVMNLDRIILRDVLQKIQQLPDVIEESSQTCIAGEIFFNALNVLSDKGCMWLNRALELTSWNGTQFMCIPVNIYAVKAYLNNV